MQNVTLPNEHIERIQSLLKQQPRVMLGLTGAPGAGKSTLAEALLAHFADCAQIVPMDGFHLANCELERLGRAARKGAPDTFDSAGYAALLKRIRQQTQPTDANTADTNPADIIYAPTFRRDLEEAIAGAIPIFPETRLIITEGNYLLLPQDAWQEVAGLLDEVWFLTINDQVRRQRLQQRHQHFGRNEAEAKAWVEQTDEPNARLIASTQARADYIIDYT